MQALPAFLVGEGSRELFLRHPNEVVEIESPTSDGGVGHGAHTCGPGTVRAEGCLDLLSPTYRVITFYLLALEEFFGSRWLKRNEYV
ncbi:MAG: hypothetical protein ACRDWH_09790 [Acidimicrobiia bacterium]